VSVRLGAFARGALRLRVLLVLALLAGLCASAAPGRGAVPPRIAGSDKPIPVLAYYYIWFQASSWNRAKTDYPILGRYWSDDAAVMTQHVRWAKRAGIDGFIVSWKSTIPLDPRLDKLMKVAEREDFKLAIIYQGLDFERNPLPASRVANDLNYFATTFASSPVFRIFGRKPLVIWSGTWKFSHADIAGVAAQVRPKMLLLASAKNVADYLRVADVTDGDAYYWSSVDPVSNANFHQEKLDEMSRTVHRHGGLWIAPAAPGYDARLLGGRIVVPRKNGDTLRQQLNVAINSSPDAVGLISWNEFSENSHVEPSTKYGSTSLQVLAKALGTTFPPNLAVASEGEDGATGGLQYGLPALIGLGALILIGVWVIVKRGRRGGGPVGLDSGGGDGTGLG
jgi:glycosyl hydrolase family 71